MKRERKIMLAGVSAMLAILVAGGAFIYGQQQGRGFAQCESGAVGGGFDAFGAPFTLTDNGGARVTDQQVFAKPSLLYFGYTFCPDVCPLDNVRNAEAVELLAERGLEVQPVFVTVDARRDTPEVMARFTEALDPRIVGLTGTQEEVAAVAKAWRVAFELMDQEDQEDYLVNHMTYTYLVLPGHGTVALFSRNTEPEEMAARTACFVENA